MASRMSRNEPRSRAMIPERSASGCRWSAYLCSSRVNRAALLAPARFFAAVELLKNRGKVTYNALQPYLRSMYEVVAVRAVPLKSVQCALRARHLNHESDGVGLTLWRVAHMLGKKKNLAFLNRNILRGLARLIDNAQNNVTLELIEELLRRIVMIVAALIRSA